MCRILYGHGWARLPPGHPLIFADVPWALQTHMRSTLQANLSTINDLHGTVCIYGIGAYRTGPCRAVSDPAVPSRTLPYCTGPSRAILDRTHRTVPYVPDRAAPYRIYMYRNRPCPTASCAPHRTCRTCVYRTVPCCAVMYRTGPDRTVPQVP